MLLVLMSLEKCFAVYFPLKAKTICTVKNAKLATGIVGFILAGCDSVYFYTVKPYISESTGNPYCFFRADMTVTVTTVDSILYSFLPFTLICITNVAIISRFITAKCKRNSTESTDQALSKVATRGTAMIVTVSVTFLLLTAPSAVSSSTFRRYSLTKNYPLYRAYMNLTQYLNHSINGVLYCIVGSRFRSEMFKIICRKTKSEHANTEHSISRRAAG